MSETWLQQGKTLIYYIYMKSLKESILTSNNSSRSQQAILDFLNSRFCDFDNDYNSYKYTVGKDSKGWYVDVEIKYRDDTYRTRSNYCDKRSIFDGWTNFNRYVRNNPNNAEGWIPCPEFRYRKIHGNMEIRGWQKLEFLQNIDEIEENLFITGCITNKDRRIYVDGLAVKGKIMIISDGFSQIRGCDPKQFFKGKLNCKNIEIR